MDLLLELLMVLLLLLLDVFYHIHAYSRPPYPYVINTYNSGSAAAPLAAAPACSPREAVWGRHAVVRGAGRGGAVLGPCWGRVRRAGRGGEQAMLRPC